MMREPQRLSLRFALKQPSTVDLDAVIPVFHRWIREKVLDDMMIDVADYKHVPESPGVILIGHDFDLGIDNGQPGHGQQGLHYTRKHSRLEDSQPLAVRLGEAWGRALQAADLLAQEAELGLVPDPTRVSLTIPDRLTYPFTAETVAAVSPVLTRFLADACGTEEVRLTHPEPDARYPLTLHASVPGEMEVGALIGR